MATQRPEVPDEAEIAERIVAASADHPYLLGYLDLDRNGPGQHLIKADLHLSKDDFDHYYASLIPYGNMTERRAYQLLTQVTDNLRQTTQLFSNVSRFGGSYRGLNGHRTALSMMRVVTDWLNYSYIYLHNETRFLTRLGARELEIFETAQSEAFDTYPAYRFMQQLRNYATHVGPPLATMQMSETENGWDTQLMLNKRQLGNGEWNKWGKAVLATLPDVFPIMPLVEEAMLGYQLIEKRTLKIYLDSVESWLKTADEILERLGEYEGFPCLYAIPPEEGKPMQTLGTSVGFAPVLTRKQIDHIKWAVVQPDPIATIWADHPDYHGFKPDQDATLKATQVMLALFSGNESTMLDQLNDVISADGGNSYSVIVGLVDLVQHGATLVGLMFNAPRENFLNVDWIEDAREDGKASS